MHVRRAVVAGLWAGAACGGAAGESEGSGADDAPPVTDSLGTSTASDDDDDDGPQPSDDGGPSTLGDSGTTTSSPADSTGSDTGDPLGPVTPTQRGDVVTFAFGNTTLEIDASVGARVVAFRLAGGNMLLESSIRPSNYGSTLWTSPQADWGWPPVAEIDSLPYSVELSDRAAAFIGEASPGLGVSVIKTFSADADLERVQIDYGLINIGDAPHIYAPWEITRVAREGVSFFPLGPGGIAPGGTPPTSQTIDDVVWIDHGAPGLGVDAKMFADGARGWLAHLAGDVLFVKAFDDVAADVQAPGEAEIEVYVNAGATYVELEAQGAYATIDGGQELDFAVRWYLRALPDDITGTIGDADLVAYVDAMVGS